MFKQKTKKSTFGNDVASLSISRFLTYFISMVGTMQLSRFRTLAEFGTYSQLLLAVHLFVSLFTLGLPYCLNYFLAKADTRKERIQFLSSFYFINSILGLLIGILLVFFIPVIESYFQNPDIKNFWIFLAFFPFAQVINQSVENLLITHKRSDYLAVFRIAHSLSVVFLITLVKILGWSFSTYVHLYLGSELVFSVVVYLLAIKLDGMFVLKFDFSLIKSIVTFAVPLGLSIAAGTLKKEMDKLVIGYFFSTEEYAVYANAAKELPLTFIATSITAVLLPVITKMIKDKKTGEAINLWKKTTAISFFLNAIFAFGLFFFSREAITLLYSEKYSSGYLVFSIYSLLMLFHSTYFGMILQSFGKTKTILKISVSSMILNFVLNVILCKFVGFSGPAIATIISMLWNSGLQLYQTAKTVNMSAKTIFPWKEIAIISSVNIVLGLLFTCVKNILPLERYINQSYEAVLLGLCWVLVYALLFRKQIKEKIRFLRSF